jgi:hypothetical protein
MQTGRKGSDPKGQVRDARLVCSWWKTLPWHKWTQWESQLLPLECGQH